jgi:protein-tyrosine phosphatase
MNWAKIKILHFLYIFRMFKDKSLTWLMYYYYGMNNDVSRQDEKQSGIINHFVKLSHELTPVIDNIYIGNACNSSSYYELKENKFKTVVNVTDEIPNYFEEHFDYFKAPIRDTSEDSLQPYFRNILEYIYKKQDKYPGKNILVHCYMGSSRSAAIVVLYLIDKHHYNLEDAINFLKEKRNIVNINVNFIQNLQEFISRKEG